MAQNLTVLTTPNKTAFTLDSKSAGITQLLYELQFYNYIFNAYQSNAGFYEFGVTSADFAEILVGMTLTFRTIDGSVAVRGTVTSLNGQLVTIDQVYTGVQVFADGYIVREDQTPVYADLPNYRIVTIIESLDPNTSYTFTLDGYGYLFMDLGRIIEPILVERGESYSYMDISYQEVWDGGSQIKQFFTKTLVTLAERQILSFLGSNLWEMMLKPSSLPDYDVGKLLTKFESKEIKRWVGWKRTISCLQDPDLATRAGEQLTWFFRDYDRNALSPIGTGTNIGITESDIEINEVELPASQGGYYTLAYVRNTIGDTDYSERFFFENCEECCEPIMLEWLNEDGAMEQYLFSLDQVIFDTVETGLSYERPITTDISTVMRTKFRQVDKWTQRMTMFENHLTRDQVDALHDIKRSDFVRVWLTKDGTEFVGVIVVEDFDDSFRSKDSLHEFSVIIEFPNGFDFYNAKKY